MSTKEVLLSTLSRVDNALAHYSDYLNSNSKLIWDDYALQSVLFSTQLMQLYTSPNLAVSDLEAIRDSLLIYDKTFCYNDYGHKDSEKVLELLCEIRVLLRSVVFPSI